MLPAFDLRFASSVKECPQLLDENWFIVAGGSEMVPAMRIGALAPDGLVDINQCDEMRVVTKVDACLEIGGLVTHSEVTHSDMVKRYAPLLGETCLNVGNARVRSTGTVGGNLCFAEPRSDLSTVFCALGASVVLVGPSGEREISVSDFVIGAFATAIGERELLVKVRVPLPVADVKYWKFTFGERPTVGIAYSIRENEIHLVIGAATEAPTSSKFSMGSIDDIVRWVEGLEIGADITGKADYKRWLIIEKVREIMEASLWQSAN